MFCKLIKPKMTPEAEQLIVEQYTSMRERDAQGSARSAWRITVRQLESLIRLSEACARLHCSGIKKLIKNFFKLFFKDDVEPKHVNEATRLLTKSIIRVEIPDVNLSVDPTSQGQCF